MKTQLDYKTNKKVALMLVGAPKTGKTTIAMAFPNPYIINADNNLGYAVSKYPGKTFWFDTPDLDEKDQPVPPEKRWLRLCALLSENATKPEVDTIVLDSMTKIGDYLSDFLVMQSSAVKDLIIGGMKCMTVNHWYPFSILMKRLVSGIRATGKHIVVVCHEKTDKDEVLGTLLYKPALSGQSADTLGGLFTDVWRTEVTVGQPTPTCPTGVLYHIRTMPQTRFSGLGNSFNLPPDYVFTWEDFAKRLEVK